MVRRPWRGVGALLGLTWCLAATAPAGAQSDADRAMARQLGGEANEALERKEFSRAAELFQRADALFHAPTLLLGLARALAGQGKLLAASEVYQRIVREGVVPGSPPPWFDALKAAEAEGPELSARLSWILVFVRGAPDAAVTLDGALVPAAAIGLRRPADPGPHTLVASAKGFASARATVTLVEGKQETVTLSLSPLSAPPASSSAPAAQPSAPPGASSPPYAAPPAVTLSAVPSVEPSSRPSLGYAALGLGGAGLLVGAVSGASFLSKRSHLDDACPNRVCPPGERDARDSYRTVGTVSTVAFVVGLVGVGAGAALLLWPADERRGAWLSPHIGPGQVGLSGGF